jgi:hypothetical protein
MAIDFAVHVGADEVRQVAERARAIEGDRRPVLDPQPEKKE